VSHPPDPLVCPGCGAKRPGDERFCPACGMPLVFADLPAGDPSVTPARERARKVKKQFLDGELVAVAAGRNQPEAEFIQGLLLEEGVPSMLRRSRGFDVPDMLAAGPRDVMVPAAGAGTAREVLLQADLLPAGEGDTRAGMDRPARLAAGLLGLLAVVGAVAWAGTELLR
jgi:zinc ribbon protein